VLLSGIAGLLAGAFSMAAGEYVSVRSQREMYEHQIGLERAELAEYPEEEAEELALIYAARGMSVSEATVSHNAPSRIPSSPRHAGSRRTRPQSPRARLSLGSGTVLVFFFSIGALVPLAPFAFARGDSALIAAVAMTAVALFGVGSMISLFTGRSACATVAHARDRRQRGGGHLLGRHAAGVSLP